MIINLVDNTLGSLPGDYFANTLQPAMDATGAWLEAKYPELSQLTHEYHLDTGRNWSVYFNRDPLETYAGTHAAASFSRNPPPEVRVKPGVAVPGLDVTSLQEALLSQSCGVYLSERTASPGSRDTLLAAYLEEFHPSVWLSLQLPDPPLYQEVAKEHPSELPQLRGFCCGRVCRPPLPHRVPRPPRRPSQVSS